MTTLRSSLTDFDGIRFARTVPISWIAMAVAAAIALFSVALVNANNIQLLEAVCWAMVLGTAGMVGFWLAASDAQSREWSPKLFGWSFLIRAAAAIVISMFLKAEVNYDASTYEYYGSCYAAFWNRQIISPPEEYLPSLKLYSEIVGLQYFLTDGNTFFPDITNAFVGALLPCVIYDIGRRNFGGEREGRAASVFACCLTAWIIWSAIAMRDIYVILCVALVLREAIGSRKITLMGWVRIAVLLGVIYLFRPYVVLILCITLAITFTFTLASKPFTRFMLGLALLCFVAGMLFVGGLSAIASQVVESQTQQLDATRQIVVYKDDHEYGADVRYNTISDVLKFLPVGLFYFLGGPFPWSYGGRQLTMSLPEIGSWYLIVWYGIRGLWLSRWDYSAVLPVVVYFIVGSILLSAVSGNFAISIRHRSMLSTSLILFAGYGWVHRKERRPSKVLSY